MAKFNQPTAKPTGVGALTTEQTATGTTHEGAAGYAKTPLTDLFLLAVTNMVGEDTFYKSAGERDTRYRDLVRQVAKQDPDWLLGFVGWLRNTANMRSAPVVAAAEAVKAGIEPGHKATARKIVNAAMSRADEPAELLAYWTTRYGRAIPKPLKRGISDAAQRLYNEYAVLKYDGAGKGFRVADVLELTHADPGGSQWRSDLYKWAIDRRHDRDEQAPDTLPMVRARASLYALPVDARRALIAEPIPGIATLKAAGITWEALAGWLQGPMDKQAWEAAIPSMGYMALLRNLRNFDQAGITDADAAVIAAKLTDPEQVAKSRQLPFRFLSAYRAAPSLRWAWPLEQALNLSLSNLPEFPGRTLVLIDTSGSMDAGLSAKTEVSRVDAAAVLGFALAHASTDRVDVCGFASDAFRFDHKSGGSLLNQIDAFCKQVGIVGMGTNMHHAVTKAYAGHDRVLIVTDDQSHDGDPGAAMPAHVPLFTIDVGGYARAATPTGPNRHRLGGLSDATFRVIPLIEAGHRAEWPWV